MTIDTRSIVLWSSPLDEGSNMARKFWTEPTAGKEVWIPRSITHHVSRDRLLGDRQRCVVEVEEWWLDKNGL